MVDSGRIWISDFTSDHQFLAYSTLSPTHHIHIFQYDGSNYTLHQSIDMGTHDNYDIDFFDNDQYLSIASYFGQTVQIYRYNSGSGFWEITTIASSLTFTSDIRAARNFGNFFVISTYTTGGTYLYEIAGETLTFAQLFPYPGGGNQ